MRNIIRTALIVSTLAAPVVSFADAPKKDDKAAKDPAAKDASKDAKPDAKAPAKKDDKATKATK
ncbi:MAG TPA: hypothetical protein VFP84_26745 [Kofleriaceae bacterium]|nr:hypothetical protein [Kofleriaceae bacterium]